MSYILDALRRSDSERERERGAIPSIHAQPVPFASSDTGPSYRVKPWVWIAVGLSAGLVVALGAIWLGRDEPPQVVSAAPPTQPPAPATTPMPASPTLQAPAPIAAEPAAVPAPSRPTQPSAQPPAPPPARPRAIPMAPPDVAPAPPRKSTSVAPAGAPVKTPASTPAPEGRIYAHAELPEDVRRQIPAVTIGGSMYSEHAANRMLIVNGQLLHEGDKVGPELTLERIKLKSAVLRFKSYRYEISY